ncbi:unnamed protein product [Clavelina lepadiformis]|uniref:Uncharacterized protein n=1 Tax=Clavelina lepadiformis TaxID=159417 RepID=A0ABP0GGJ6_CLALP
MDLRQTTFSESILLIVTSACESSRRQFLTMYAATEWSKCLPIKSKHLGISILLTQRLKHLLHESLRVGFCASVGKHQTVTSFQNNNRLKVIRKCMMLFGVLDEFFASQKNEYCIYFIHQYTTNI